MQCIHVWFYDSAQHVVNYFFTKTVETYTNLLVDSMVIIIFLSLWLTRCIWWPLTINTRCHACCRGIFQSFELHSSRGYISLHLTQWSLLHGNIGRSKRYNISTTTHIMAIITCIITLFENTLSCLLTLNYNCYYHSTLPRWQNRKFQGRYMYITIAVYKQCTDSCVVVVVVVVVVAIMCVIICWSTLS